MNKYIIFEVEDYKELRQLQQNIMNRTDRITFDQMRDYMKRMDTLLNRATQYPSGESA